MKKYAFPLVALAVVASAFVAATKMSRDLRAARAENAVLAERLSRAEAVAAAVMRIDKLYREAKDENAVLAKRLMASKSPSPRRVELKDAVADRPSPPKQRPASRSVPLPGYSQ